MEVGDVPRDPVFSLCTVLLLGRGRYCSSIHRVICLCRWVKLYAHKNDSLITQYSHYSDRNKLIYILFVTPSSITYVTEQLDNVSSLYHNGFAFERSPIRISTGDGFSHVVSPIYYMRVLVWCLKIIYDNFLVHWSWFDIHNRYSVL
jgi:hypothetical protein